VNGALFELLWRGWRGGLVRRARRLRQPRYLIAFLVSAGYFAFLVLPSFLGLTRQPRGPFGRGPAAVDAAAAAAMGGAAAEAARLVEMAAALVLAVVVTLTWALGSSKPALRLGEADIHLLLPAPVPRRKLIELALWRQQAGLLFGAAVLALLRGQGSPGARLSRLFAAWAALTLISLHSQGMSLWKARLRELPAAAARLRAGVVVTLWSAWWLGVILGLRSALAAPAAGAAGAVTTIGPPGTAAGAAGSLGAAAAAGGGKQAIVDAIHRLAGSPPSLLLDLLAPLRWIAASFLGGSGMGTGWPGGGSGRFEQLPRLLLLAALVAVHYQWVVRSRARFEDAAIERARRQAERRSRRPGLPAPAARARRREPFRLPPAGLPEAAIYWKNLLIPRRRPLARSAWLVALPGAAAWALGAALGAPVAYVAGLAGAGLMLMVMVPPLAALYLRHDLRSDLLQVEVLRCWPLPGWRLVAAELLAPATTAITAALVGCGLVLGVTAAAGGRVGRDDVLHLALRAEHWQGPAGGGSGAFGWVLGICSALLIAGLAITLLATALQNLAALLLPGWMALGPERRPGSALAGQRLLMLLGHVLALAAALLPALLVGAAALFAGSRLGLAPAPWQPPLLALLAALPLLAEIALLVRAAGALWDRLDPSAELLAPAD
jgi:ABC-2 type transport system permease protein